MRHNGGAPGRGGEESATHRRGKNDISGHELFAGIMTNGHTGRDPVGATPRKAWRHPAPADGRVALVTGGNRGLGLRIVRELAARGMRVVMATRSAASGHAAVDLLGDLADRVAVRQLDITDPQSVTRLAFAVQVLLGRCDVLVNNAAVLLERDTDRAVSVDLDLALRTLETNVLGTWRMTQAVVPMMRAHRYGRIVNVAGDLDMSGVKVPAYRMSKEAVNSLTRTFAQELAGDGILVNSYCPEAAPHDDDPSLFSAPPDTPVWLATLPDDGPTGGLYQQRAPSEW